MTNYFGRLPAIRTALLLASFSVAWLCLGVSQSFAVGIFYGSGGFSSDLIRIDTSDGSSSVIGNMAGLSFGVGMAFNPNTNTMYTRDFDTLFTVNVSNANTALVGPSGTFITSLAFSTDFSTLYGFDPSTGDFYHVNPGNGTAVLVGNTGITTPLDMSMSSSGVLWAADLSANIYTITPANGASNLVWPAVDARGLTSIQFDPLDNLYGVTASFDMLVQINLGNGTTADVGGPIVDIDIRGMPFIPEPTGLSLAGLGLIGLLAYGRRRRRA